MKKNIVFLIIVSLVVTPLFSSIPAHADKASRIEDRIYELRSRISKRKIECRTGSGDYARAKARLDRAENALREFEEGSGNFPKKDVNESREYQRLVEEVERARAEFERFSGGYDSCQSEIEEMERELERLERELERIEDDDDDKPRRKKKDDDDEDCINCEAGKKRTPHEGKKWWEIIPDTLRAVTPLGLGAMGLYGSLKGMKYANDNYSLYANMMNANGLPFAPPNTNGFSGMIGSFMGPAFAASMFMNGGMYGAGGMYGMPFGGMGMGMYPGMYGGAFGGGFAIGSGFAMGGMGMMPMGMGYMPMGMGGGFAVGNAFAIGGGFAMGGGFAPMGMGYSPMMMGGMMPMGMGGGFAIGNGFAMGGGFAPMGMGYSPMMMGGMMPMGMGYSPMMMGGMMPMGMGYMPMGMGGGFAVGNAFAIGGGFAMGGGFAPMMMGGMMPMGMGYSPIGMSYGSFGMPIGQGFAVGQAFAIGQAFAMGMNMGGYPMPGYPGFPGGGIYPPIGGQFPGMFNNPWMGYGMNPYGYGGLNGYNPWFNGMNNQFNAGGMPQFYQNQQQQLAAQMRVLQQQQILSQDGQAATQALYDAQNRYMQVMQQMQGGGGYFGGQMGYNGAGYMMPQQQFQFPVQGSTLQTPGLNQQRL